jgi:hypothetical protein
MTAVTLNTRGQVILVSPTDQSVTTVTHVPNPEKPSFEANRITDQTGCTAGAYNKVQLNNEVSDPNNLFDAVTNFRFQPTEPGTYHVEGSISAAASASGQAPVGRALQERRLHD